MRGLEFSSIHQLLDNFENPPDIQLVLELFEYLSFFLHTKLCSPPISMCCRLLCVHPFLRPIVIMSFKSSIFIHISLVELHYTQICFNHPPVTTVAHCSLPAMKYICIHRNKSFIPPPRHAIMFSSLSTRSHCRFFCPFPCDHFRSCCSQQTKA